MNGNQNNEYDTRKILEQMREEYWHGLPEAEIEESKNQLQVVTVVLGNELFGMPALEAKEILKPPTLTRVPRTPSAVMGIFNLRGKITSVVDIRSVLELKKTDLTDKSRVVIVEVGAISTGVLVEEVREITQIPRENIIPVARTITRKEYLTGQTELDGVVLVLLDMEKILTARDFQIHGLNRESRPRTDNANPHPAARGVLFRQLCGNINRPCRCTWIHHRGAGANAACGNYSTGSDVSHSYRTNSLQRAIAETYRTIHDTPGGN